MAYQFGAGSQLTTTLDTTNTLRSYVFRFYQIGNGGSNNGRIFDKRESGDPARERFYAASTTLKFRREYTTTAGEWAVDQPSLNEWHHCVITYDDSSTANDPIIYIDGALVTVTESITPVGTLRPDNTSNYVWGNDGTATDYYWDGYLAECAIIDGIVSAEDAMLLYEGLLPSEVGTVASHCPMFDSPVDLIITDATATNLTVVDHPGITGGVGIGEAEQINLSVGELNAQASLYDVQSTYSVDLSVAASLVTALSDSVAVESDYNCVNSGLVSSFVTVSGSVVQENYCSVNMIEAVMVDTSFTLPDVYTGVFQSLLCLSDLPSVLLTSSSNLATDGLTSKSVLPGFSLNVNQNLSVDYLTSVVSISGAQSSYAFSASVDSLVSLPTLSWSTVTIDGLLTMVPIDVTASLAGGVVGQEINPLISSLVGDAFSQEISLEQTFIASADELSVFTDIGSLSIDQSSQLSVVDLNSNLMLNMASIVQLRSAVVDELVAAGVIAEVIASPDGVRIFPALYAFTESYIDDVGKSLSFSVDSLSAMAVTERALINNLPHFKIHSSGIFSITQKTGVQSVH